MSRKKPKKRGLCALCGKLNNVTKEHFVPQCLWYGPRPNRTETVPTCEGCNQGASDDDNYFRDVLVMMFGQKSHPEKEALFAGKVKRSLGHKKKWVKTFLSDVRASDLITPSGLWAGRWVSLPLDRERFERVLRKIVKGLFYLVRDEPLPEDAQIEFVAYLDTHSWGFIKFVDPLLTSALNFGDDVFEWQSLQTRDGASVWKIAFYTSVVFYSLVLESS